MSRFLAVMLDVLLLGVCFLLSAAVSSYACSVTDRTIIESSLDDCSPPSGWIYKLETNRITFSDGDFDNTLELPIHFSWKTSVGTKAVEEVGVAHQSVWHQENFVALIPSVAVVCVLTDSAATEKSDQGVPC